MKKMACLVVASLLLSCQRADEPRGNILAQQVEGWRYTLSDPSIIWDLTFMPDGNCIATMGSTTGAVAGPVFNWRITKHHTLQILDSDGRPIQEWLTLSVQGTNAIIINTSGTTGIFARVRFQ